jgi:hypothetical protein
VAWWAACLWGLVGSAAVEALELYRAIQRVKGFPWRMPDEVPLAPYLVALIIRNALGAGLAAAFGVSGQIAGPLGAIAVGVAAPKIVEQLMRQGLSHPAVAPTPVTASASPIEEPASSAPVTGQPQPSIEGEAGVA